MRHRNAGRRPGVAHIRGSAALGVLVLSLVAGAALGATPDEGTPTSFHSVQAPGSQDDETLSRRAQWERYLGQASVGANEKTAALWSALSAPHDADKPQEMTRAFQEWLARLREHGSTTNRFLRIGYLGAFDEGSAQAGEIGLVSLRWPKLQWTLLSYRVSADADSGYGASFGTEFLYRWRLPEYEHLELQGGALVGLVAGDDGPEHDNSFGPGISPLLRVVVGVDTAVAGFISIAIIPPPLVNTSSGEGYCENESTNDGIECKESTEMTVAVTLGVEY